LDALAAREPRRAKVIELRYFGGLTVEETAEALGVSPQTVLREWKLARAWLAVELRSSSTAGGAIHPARS
jgi:RNA polymerase sigma factor (sigma-70 family)